MNLSSIDNEILESVWNYDNKSWKETFCEYHSIDVLNDKKYCNGTEPEVNGILPSHGLIYNLIHLKNIII